ncbi:hypothetical protein KO561_06350 [Radiobacillus kanasensis]|uniref:hypothetical protein n=1 Tax=Radiobacillus kanasensis TaxID=2844358 RepID=UPI001E3A47BB|nr:hypothetical protein [Radiobacillus kanasensis]UFU00559.1 hypothetical protein KO561_06350 [Radiobacillus kanasensis]
MFFQKGKQQQRAPHQFPNPHPYRRPYGPPTRQPSKQSESDDEAFDLMDTAQTVMKTYDQLSPYVKSISKRFLNRKKD